MSEHIYAVKSSLWVKRGKKVKLGPTPDRSLISEEMLA
jgi:hypothetical protein